MYTDRIVAALGDGQDTTDFEVEADYDLSPRAVIEAIRVYHKGEDITIHLSDEAQTAAECFAAAEIETRHNCIVAIGEVV